MLKALVGEGPESCHPGPSGQISQGAWIRRVLVFPYLAVIVHPPRQGPWGAWTRSGSSSAIAQTAVRCSSCAAGVIGAIAIARGPVPTRRGTPPCGPRAGATSRAAAGADSTPPGKRTIAAVGLPARK